MKPQIIDRSISYKDYLTVEKLHVRLADGAVVSRDFESHGNAAAVLPYDPRRHCALIVRLFRAPVFNVTQEGVLEEACAGMIDEGESDETAARREAYEISMLQKLVHYYHRGEDWNALVALSHPRQSDEAMQFEYLRFEYDLGILDDPDDYESLIFESMEAGMPAKALAVLAQANQREIFSKDRYERIRHALDFHDVGVPERLRNALNRAERDSTADSDALVARIYLDTGAYARAAAAARRGIAKGNRLDQDVVRLNLGIAYLRNGEPRLAEDAFDTISSLSPWAPLAQLWKLHAEDQGSRPKVITAHDVS